MPIFNRFYVWLAGFLLVGGLLWFLVSEVRDSAVQKDRLEHAVRGATQAEVRRIDRLEVDVSQEAARRAVARSVAPAIKAAAQTEVIAHANPDDARARAAADRVLAEAVRAGNSAIESSR